jgi:hypothetical protein
MGSEPTSIFSVARTILDLDIGSDPNGTYLSVSDYLINSRAG